MLVLLPPSEGKTRPGGRRARLDLGRLSWPELGPAREQVLNALQATSSSEQALAVLAVGPSLTAEVAANILLRTAPAAPAAEVYSGVLYDALDLTTLSAGARRRANRLVVVQSALWGAVRLTDRIPAYRLSMGTTLPDVGPLAAFWRNQLSAPLTATAGSGIVLDARSSTYRAAWVPPSAVANRTVAVRVLRDGGGQRTVVSHMAKHTRGLVVRHLLERPSLPRSPQAVATAVSERFECELTRPERSGGPWHLDVIVRT